MQFIKQIYILALSLSALTLISCDPASKFRAELKTIDSSLAVLDSIQGVYDGIEFDSLKLMVAHVKSNEGKMKAYYSSDTMNQELGMLMNNCKGIRKSLQDVEGQKLIFGDEIFVLKKQFGDLKTDILNGALDKEKIAEYLPAEVEALEKLSLKFYEFYDLQRMQKSVYYSAVPKVDEYVLKLQIPDAPFTEE